MTSWWHDQAGRFPLLTGAQEIHLGTMVRQWLDHPDPVPPAIVRRGLRARDRFVRANLRLVLSFAERFRSVPEFHRDDLIQAGNLGLLRAVEKFDPTRGYKFSTYAYWWIRQGCGQYLEQHSRTIRLPSNHSAQFGRMQAAISELCSTLHRPPTRAEIAEACGWDPELLDRILARPAATTSLDQPVRNHDDRAAFGDNLSDPDAADPLDAIDAIDRIDRVMAALAELSPAAQRLIGGEFLGESGGTLAQLAKREGMSRDRARAVVAQGLAHIRQRVNGSPAPPTAPQQPAQPGSYGPQLALPLL